MIRGTTLSSEGRVEAYRFAFKLLVEDLNHSTFMALPFDTQLALAADVGLTVDDLAKAMRYLSAYHDASATALEEWNERRPNPPPDLKLV